MKKETSDPRPSAEVEDLAQVRSSDVSDLPPRRMVPAEGRYTVWDVTLDHGTAKDDLLRTSFWRHHTQRPRPLDEIRAVCEDGSFVAYLIIQAVGPKDIKVHIREFVDMDPVQPDALQIPEGYKVDWGGRISLWRARRGNDVLKDGFQSKSEATRWLGSHIQAMAR